MRFLDLRTGALPVLAFSVGCASVALAVGCFLQIAFLQAFWESLRGAKLCGNAWAELAAEAGPPMERALPTAIFCAGCAAVAFIKAVQMLNWRRLQRSKP